MIAKHTPFESLGRFFPGYVQYAGTTNRAGRRRVLCFVTTAGVLGASATFSRAEAFNTALSAEQSALEYKPGRTAADTLKNVLKARGFPVSSSADEVDDNTATALARELKLRVTHA